MSKQNNPRDVRDVEETVLAGADEQRERPNRIETALMHLSPVGRDESGIGVVVDEVGRYATLDFDIPSGLPLSDAARSRLESMRAARIEYTDHTDRAYEDFWDFPPTDWLAAAPFVHKVRDARRSARWDLMQELRRVALDFLAETVREGSADEAAVQLLRRMMLRDEA